MCRPTPSQSASARSWGRHRQRRGHLERVRFCQGRHRGRPYRMADPRAVRWLRPAKGRSHARADLDCPRRPRHARHDGLRGARDRQTAWLESPASCAAKRIGPGDIAVALYNEISPHTGMRANGLSIGNTASKSASKRRGVVAGVSLCAAAPLELPCATSSGGKPSCLVVKFFIYLVSAGNKTRDSKQQLHFQQYQI
jgi:hypothetical protein